MTSDFIWSLDIIIKSADKGGTTVVLTKELYQAEVFRQLHNSTYYTSLSEPIYSNTALEIIKGIRPTS